MTAFLQIGRSMRNQIHVVVVIWQVRKMAYAAIRDRVPLEFLR
jgi:hypothetical protein